MSAEDVRSLCNARPRDGLYGTDGHGVLLANRPDCHGINRLFRSFSGGDWNLCFYGGGGADTAYYNTRIGELFGAEGTWDADATQLAIARTLRQMIQAGPSAHYARRRVLIMAGPNPEWCLQYGIDVQGWVRERLVDIVMPYPRGIERSADDMIAGVAEFAALLRGADVPMLPSLGSYADHNLSLRDYRRRAHAFYTAGADGIARWDTQPWLARLGLNNAEAQRLWVEKYMPPPVEPLVSMAGLNRVIFSPRHGV